MAVATGLAHGALTFNDTLIPSMFSGACSIRFAYGTTLGSVQFGKHMYKGIICRSIEDLAQFLDALAPPAEGELSFQQLCNSSLYCHLHEPRIAIEKLNSPTWYDSSYNLAVNQLKQHSIPDLIEKQQTLGDVFQTKRDLLIRSPLPSRLYTKKAWREAIDDISTSCKLWQNHPSIVLHVNTIFADSNQFDNGFRVPVAIQLIGPASTSISGVKKLFKLACSVSKIFPDQMIPVFHVPDK